MYAAKYVKKTKQSKKDVSQEIAMMAKLHHKGLARLLNAYETPQFMILVMELITGGELFEKVVEEDNLTERQVVRYLRQTLYAVQHMHRYNMVHLDLKPENILCVGGDPPGYEKLKLIDFGMARVLEKGKKEIAACGTAEFVAPEVLRLDPISLAVDMWSIGVITYVLLSGLSPFLGDSDHETLANVSNGEYDFDDGEGIFDQISDGAKQFIEQLLVMDVTKRNTVDECLEHEWCKRAKEKKLKTDKLKKFIARRRWQRTTNALKAVTRLGHMGLLHRLTGDKNGTKGSNNKANSNPGLVKSEAVDAELVNKESVNPEPAKTVAVNSEAVNPEPVKEELMSEPVNAKPSSPGVVSEAPVNPDPAKPVVVNSEAVNPEPVKEESVSEPVNSKQSGPGAVNEIPVNPEPVKHEADKSKVVNPEPVKEESVTKPVSAEPATSEAVNGELVKPNPVNAEPNNIEPANTKPEEPISQPVTTKPANPVAVNGEPVISKAKNIEESSVEPVNQEPSKKKPVIKKPAMPMSMNVIAVGNSNENGNEDERETIVELNGSSIEMNGGTFTISLQN
eukprot:Seg1777.3 transcript_id=Seg1777.3/GoldUCD/mRNA.D3Y31 product="Myosin light chain kinase smooth muscle" protein_id=Seg1777.3/GoldUCD/D3Y31